jgi:predicted kinase
MKKNNLKILLLVGIPASGKSSWAKDFLRNNPDWVRVSRDDFRLMLRNEQMCEPKVEDLITTLVNQAITKTLTRKLNVIVDATNVREKYINEFIDTFKYMADIDYRVFDISLDKAIERDNNRQMKVGEEVIKRMYNNYKTLINSFHFQPVNKISHRPQITPNFKSELPDAVIFDIDGTLALMKNRGGYDWDKVDRDDVNLIVSEQIEFHKSKGRKIIIVTGRDAVCRDMTVDWLTTYNIYFDHIFMRPENDFRKDTVIKKEIYENHIVDNYNIIAVYDDRLSVVLDTWHKLGLFVFNVNQGNIEF